VSELGAIGTRGSEPTQTGPTLKVGFALVRVAIAVFALYGLAEHTASAVPWKPHPVADTSTIAFVALLLWCLFPVLFNNAPTIAGVPLPALPQRVAAEREKRIGVATTSLDQYTEIVDSLSNLLACWTESLVIFDALLAKAEDDPAARMILLNFLRDRMGEAKEWMGDTPGSNVRLALWVYNPVTKRIGFLFSNEIVDEATKTATFAPGEGIMGQVLIERRTWDERDVSQIPAYKLRNQQPDRFATLCVPLGPAVVSDAIGVLTVDKPENSYFSRTAHEVAQALSAICYDSLVRYDRRAGRKAAAAA
jgi:hypothetical protein